MVFKPQWREFIDKDTWRNYNHKGYWEKNCSAVAKKIEKIGKNIKWDFFYKKLTHEIIETEKSHIEAGDPNNW